MDSIEQVSQPYPAGQLSPAKFNNSMEHLGGGKRDSAYSSFSTSSGTPDYTFSKSNTTSTENMSYKVNQWDAGGKHNSGRNTQSQIDGVKQDDRVAYFQMPGVNAGIDGPHIEDPASSRHSTSSRTSFGPVWHVPEKKKTASSSSPPPPPPPARSDSFAATKVHERGLVLAHHEASDSQVPCKASDESRRSHSLYTSSDKSSHNQFTSNKHYSLSNSDAHQGQPYHKIHHSDKSTFYSQPWSTSGPKPQTVGAYYCSMQELPTNGSAQHVGQNNRRNLSTSLSTIATDQNNESSGHNRYYCVTTQPNPQPLSGKPEDMSSVTSVDLAGNERKSLSPQTVTKVTYHLPQHHSLHNKDSNGYSKPHVTSVLETTVPKPVSEDRGSQRGQNAEVQYTGYPPSRHAEQRRSLPLHNREFPQDVRHHSQVSNKISPQATPMLHSLSMDASRHEEKAAGAVSEESLESKQLKRSDRFATTLRNEIQIRRANLQKSKSVDAETEIESSTTFPSSYTVNLKEAQARVLKATSFKRKDLEPVLVENPAAEALPIYPSAALGRKDISHLPTVTESVTTKSGYTAGQVTRIGGRKRFTAEEKVRSFSEPDKIHEVGVKENLPPNENTRSSLDQQKVFKESATSGCSSRIRSYTENPARDLASTCGAKEGKGIQIKGVMEAQRVPYSSHNQATLDQQRLGTFAEYEAQWNIQKKTPETRASGRYGSADNILDPGQEERTKTACFHVRSKSSPSADIYGQVRVMIVK